MSVAVYIAATHYGFGGHLVFVKSLKVVIVVSFGFNFRLVLKLTRRPYKDYQTGRGSLRFGHCDGEIISDLTL